MVSVNCKIVVSEELVKLGLHPVKVGFGEAEIEETLSDVQQHQLKNALSRSGYELLEERKDILVQMTKNALMELIYSYDEPMMLNMSVQLSQKLHLDYTYLSNLFSEATGGTIERFYICQKIERTKELMIREGLTLTNIAFKLNYSSVAHLSNQFKKVTGVTPSQFKLMKKDQRGSLKSC